MTTPEQDEFEQSLLGEADQFEQFLLEEVTEDGDSASSTNSSVGDSRPDKSHHNRQSDRPDRDIGERDAGSEADNTRMDRGTESRRVRSAGTQSTTPLTGTEHFPLIPEPKYPPPTYADDAELSEMGRRVLRDLWSAPNNDRDIEHLAAYFSVPPVVVFRGLRDLELIPEEYSGEAITLEWMLNDAKLQRQREREARERLLRDNDGRDIESMFDYEEWAITTPLSATIPLQDLVIGSSEVTPLDYFAAEDEVRAQEIEKLIDLGGR